MGNVVRGLGIASSGAHGRVVRLGLRECLNAHVAGGCVDGGVAVGVWTRETGGNSWGGGSVDVRSGDDDLELVLPAALVFGRV